MVSWESSLGWRRPLEENIWEKSSARKAKVSRLNSEMKVEKRLRREGVERRRV